MIFLLKENFLCTSFFQDLWGFNFRGVETAKRRFPALHAMNAALLCTFGQIRRFGCSHCYEAFGEALVPLFRRLHGNQKHMGKIPARAGADVKVRKEIERLRKELQKRIAEEAFEEAARIRDEIRRLESEHRLGGEKHEQ